MAKPAAPPLTFVAGDDETVIVGVTSDAAGTTAVDITGRTYVLSIATAPGVTPVASAAGTVDGPAGEVSFTFAAAVTALLVATGGSYTYDVVETASGAESTLILAPLSVQVGVTA